MMITYSKIKDNAILLLALTGITSSEFEILLIAFEEAWGDYIRLICRPGLMTTCPLAQQAVCETE